MVDYLSEYQGQSNAKEVQKSRFAKGNSRKKDLSKIIRDFDKLPYKSYDRRSPKHESTDSYFYLASQFVKCVMRADALNLPVYPVRKEMIVTKYITI